MSKEIHNELYDIEDYVDVEHVIKLSKSLLDVRFWTGDNFIRGTRDDVEEHMSPYYSGLGSDGYCLSPLSIEKIDDQMNNSFLTIKPNFISYFEFLC